MSDTSFYQIAVDAPLPSALTYRGSETNPHLERGQIVEVPLGKRKATGVVLKPSASPPAMTIKSIHRVIEELPQIPAAYVQWLEWLAEFYLYPIGQVLALAAPPLQTRQRRGSSKKKPVIPENGPLLSQDQSPKRSLTSDQQRVIQAISLQTNFHTNLIHGVTGSGKTEVYLQLLERTLNQGQQGLVLVPEISLTPQLLQRFAERFGDKVAVIHSHLTDRERTEQWWAAASGEKSILVGARSALFCPLPRLGMIVVDEEHEASFKQDEKLKYHARDAAIMLAKILDRPIVLGSATPALESWHHAKSGRYQLHEMPRRIMERELPKIELVDLRETHKLRRDGGGGESPFWLSKELHLAMETTLAKGEQVALFLNRRGVAQSALCEECGHGFSCPNCAISLTLHGHNHLVCHYCDYTERLPERCPKCDSPDVKALGLGTELIERDVRKLFPEARVARADRDEIQNREDLEDLIQRFEGRELDILVGTQMIAKGLDFPGLTLVGLVLADVGLHWPDFRASERAFQLLTQVAGRAGRHSQDPGSVLIQTYNPEHPSLLAALAQDHSNFYEQELRLRESLRYPPFSRLALLRFQGASEASVAAAAAQARRRLEALIQKHSRYQDIEALGPAPAPLTKLRGKFRYHLLLKGSTPGILQNCCRHILGDASWIPAQVRGSVDINPINML